MADTKPIYFLRRNRKKKKSKTVRHTLPTEAPDTVAPIADVSLDLSNYRNRYPDLRDQVVPDYWVLPNKALFLDWLNTTFARPSVAGAASCACSNELCKDVGLFPQQKLVKDFFQLLSPYRGILLYHGLGVGKTCASIAIAEGMADNRKVIFLSKASLEQNFVNELSFCGNDYYIKNANKWEFVECVPGSQQCKIISKQKGISEDIINRNGGVWLIDTTSSDKNYASLSELNRKQIDNQIIELIHNKYSFMHYDASNLSAKLDAMIGNPFDNKLLIIEEIHNLTNSMVNGGHIARFLENRMMTAKNLKIVALSGTPLVNDIYEIAKLFNLLRGHIETYILTFTHRVNYESIKTRLMREPSVDYIVVDERGKRLIITRNPFGFINNADKTGVIKSDTNISEEEFIQIIEGILTKMRITFDIENKLNMALPDDQEVFYKYFYNTRDNSLENVELFSSRINGLVSYYRTAGQELMPEVILEEEVKVPMSDFQFSKYLEIRTVELQKERGKSNPGQGKRTLTHIGDTPASVGQGDGGNIFKISDTFKAFSRMACSFVFPDSIGRPRKESCKIMSEFEIYAINNYDKWKGRIGDNDHRTIGGVIFDKFKSVATITFDALPELVQEFFMSNMERFIQYAIDKGVENEKLLASESVVDVATRQQKQDEIKRQLKKLGNKRVIGFYEELKVYSLSKLVENEEEYLVGDGLMMYSPKYHSILDNVSQSPGTVFIYSEYRNLEGLGILSKVLDANGYTEFKVIKTVDGWDLNIDEGNMAKSKYIKWGGQGDMDDILLKIFNSKFEDIKNKSPALNTYLTDKNNFVGDIAKIFMSTKTGAEGITLKNVRQVHILEPYWNYGRLEQVKGRAIRACSHEMLPEADRNVSIYTYITTFTELQKVDKSIEKDEGKTTDEYLYELSLKKKKIIDELFHVMKESAFDCNIHFAMNNEEEKPLVCVKHLDYSRDGYIYGPNITMDLKDAGRDIRKEKVVRKVSTNLKTIQHPHYSRKFIIDLDNNGVYTILPGVKLTKDMRIGNFSMVEGKLTSIEFDTENATVAEVLAKLKVKKSKKRRPKK